MIGLSTLKALSPMTWRTFSPALSVGATRAITIVVLVESGFSGVLTNTAVITAPTNDPLPGNNTDTVGSTINTQADLVLGKFSAPDPHVPGTVLTYTLVVTNPGPSSLTAITLTDNLPAAVQSPLYRASQGSFNPASGVRYDKRFDEVKTAPLLVLDDLGTESATAWAREKLYQLFNYRYNARLPTVITTVTPIDELDPRLAARMLDGSRCTFFVLEVPSYRGGLKPKRRLRKRK